MEAFSNGFQFISGRGPSEPGEPQVAVSRPVCRARRAPLMHQLLPHHRKLAEQDPSGTAPPALESVDHWDPTDRPWPEVDVTLAAKCLLGWAMLLSSPAQVCRGSGIELGLFVKEADKMSRLEPLSDETAPNKVHRF